MESHIFSYLVTPSNDITFKATRKKSNEKTATVPQNHSLCFLYSFHCKAGIHAKEYKNMRSMQDGIHGKENKIMWSELSKEGKGCEVGLLALLPTRLMFYTQRSPTTSFS